jgi:hypothetical protein
MFKKVIVLVACLVSVTSVVSAEKRLKVDEKTKVQIIDALKVNDELHASFFKYDGKKIEAVAKKLNLAFDKINDPSISKLLVFAKKKLVDIKEANDKKLNNENYHIVSSALIFVINKYDLGNEYNAYSCPMVKKKWIQNSKKMTKVHNPYAAGMPHCGSQDSSH